MPKVEQLQTLQLRDLINRSTSLNRVAEGNEQETKDFGGVISDFIQAVNDAQKESAEKVQDVIQGRTENLHEAMAALEEARLSFQLMLEIRNKLLESYQEIQRTQV